ncbi:unnamed protein product [Musa acuminata subsp. malaccensis]|uniref:(wild Malaysian banana) hypothetical protein n=1 Tax=Musa acuminata subsp. malaccensis TaxID=214687 RepID=A0A804IFT7_MUSAM|nr:unnamed protein product [Musa acuminata subsp. malaccensis]
MSRTVTRTGHQVRTRVFISSNEGLRCLTRVPVSRFRYIPTSEGAFRFSFRSPFSASFLSLVRRGRRRRRRRRRSPRSGGCGDRTTRLRLSSRSTLATRAYIDFVTRHLAFLFSVNAHALRSIYLLRKDCR